MLSPYFAVSRLSRYSGKALPSVSVTSLNTESRKIEKATLLSNIAQLSKVRLSSLVIATTGAGFVAAGLPIAWDTLAYTVTGTSLAAASANAFNQIIERESDARMLRTRLRPLPANTMTVNSAITWAVTSGVSSAALLFFGANPMVAALGVGNIVLYSAVYTIMKSKSEMNTMVGAAVGAIPPLMGYCAATNGLGVISPESMILASLLYLWQFPHFYSLAYYNRKDYARGGIQVVPVNDPTGFRTARYLSVSSCSLLLIPLSCAMLDVTSPWFVGEMLLLSGYMMKLANDFKLSLSPVAASSSSSSAASYKLFKYSLLFLPVTLMMFLIHEKKLGLENWIKEKIGGKNACVHEIIIDKLNGEGAAACPAVVVAAKGQEIKEAEPAK